MSLPRAHDVPGSRAVISLNRHNQPGERVAGAPFHGWCCKGSGNLRKSCKAMGLLQEPGFPPHLVLLPPEQRSGQKDTSISLSYGSSLGPRALKGQEETRQPRLKTTREQPGFSRETESTGDERQRQTSIHRRWHTCMHVKEEAHTTMWVGKSEICRAGLQAGSSGRNWRYSPRQNFFFAKKAQFSLLKAFNWLEEALTHCGG